MESKRSDGVLVLGIIAIVFGIWSLLHDFNSIYSLISYLLFIVSGIAVLKIRNWGRILLIVTSAVEFVASLILPYVWTTIMSNEHHTAWVLPTPIPILYVMNIWFFNKRRIREEFGRGGQVG